MARNLMIMAAFLFGLASLLAGITDRLPQPSSPGVAVAATKAVDKAPPMNVSGRTVRVERDRRGHYQVEARVADTMLAFMVDTGASVIALKERDAARLGIRPMRSDFTVNVSTANGNVKAARAQLRSVDVGGLLVRDVSALVLPDAALSENLLGLSYLSKLKRFEFADNRLVLEQ